MKRFLIASLAAVAAALVTGSADPGAVLWRQASFEEFRHGTLEDGGANTYISARGAIQLINRWDYNNDGHLDLLFVSTHDHREKLDAFLYPNRGGDFREKDLVPLPTNGGNWGLIQDLNGDGHPDIVIANTDNGTIGDLESFVYWGSKEGFSALNRSELPTIFVGRPAAGDLNRDGFIDLVFPNGAFLLHPGDQTFDRGSFVYWGGPEGFRADRRLELPAFDATAAAVADFDGDGWLDVALASRTPPGVHRVQIGGTEGEPERNSAESFIYWGGADGLSSRQRTTLVTERARTLRAYDVDADGRPEPVFLDDRGLVIYRSVGRRQFEPVVVSAARGARDFAIADLNRDGRPDLVLAATPGKILWGQGKSAFDASRPLELPTLSARGCETADLDGNGYPDVIFANNNDGDTFDIRSYIYWNGPEGFSAARRRELLSSGASSVVAGDADGDGRQDLLVLNGIGGHVRRTPTYIYFGNPRGEYSPGRRRVIETIEGNDGASADFNDDGFTDLVLTQNLRLPRSALPAKSGIAAEAGRLAVQPIYWGGPDSFLTLKTSYLPMFGSYGASVADLNRDGYLDLVLSGYYRRPGAKTDVSRIFFGTANGFTANRMQDLDTPGAEPSLIADFNRDGWLDLVFPNRKTGSAEGSIVYFGAREGYSRKTSVVLPTAHTTRAQAADLNGDGWLELIFSNQIDAGSQYTPALIYWGGPAGFSLKRRTELPTWGGYGICVADFNRDKYLDIAIPSYKGYRTRKTNSIVFWGGPLGYLETNYTHLPSDSGAECMAADFNDDGWSDLLIVCHRRDGDHQAPGRPSDHAAESFLYWSGPDGFNPKPDRIPSVGAHCNNSVDYGNVYDRRLRWGYVSAPFRFGSRPPESIHWEAKTPFATFVRFQLRTAATEEALGSAAWRGPAAALFYTRSGEAVGAVTAGHAWMQYRIELGITRGTGNPEVTAVEFRTKAGK